MFMTTAEVATMFRLSRTTILDPRWRGKVGLEVTRIGGRLLFETAAVEDLIQRSKEKLPTALEHSGQFIQS